MSKVFLFASLPVLMTIGLMLTGCSNEQPSQQPSASPETPESQPAATGHEGHEDHAEHSGHAGHSEYEEELSQLSADDRALAEEQKVCPVSGDPLGAMGKPYKVTVNGREVFLCCPGCEARIKENPGEYLAKLPK